MGLKSSIGNLDIDPVNGPASAALVRAWEQASGGAAPNRVVKVHATRSDGSASHQEAFVPSSHVDSLTRLLAADPTVDGVDVDNTTVFRKVSP